MVTIEKWCIIHIWYKLSKLTMTASSHTTESQYVNVTSYLQHVIWINKMAYVRWRGKKGEIKSTCLCYFPSQKTVSTTQSLWIDDLTALTFFPLSLTFSSVSIVSHSPTQEREKTWKTQIFQPFLVGKNQCHHSIVLNPLQEHCLDGNTDVISLTNE